MLQGLVDKGYSVETIGALLAYSACSSLMLIVNKVAVSEFPLPSLVTLLQLVFCCFTIFAIYKANPAIVSPTL